MNLELEGRVREHAELFAARLSNPTIRNVAKETGWSKSTVYIDLTKRLPQICPLTARLVRSILRHNEMDRNRRGGLATQRIIKERRKDYERQG